jgi:hypothetical protein
MANQSQPPFGGEQEKKTGRLFSAHHPLEQRINCRKKPQSPQTPPIEGKDAARKRPESGQKAAQSPPPPREPRAGLSPPGALTSMEN